MTATVDIITTTKNDIVGVPISAVVVKTDTSSVKKIVISEEATAGKEERFECVFVKDGENAKLRVVKTGIQDDTNIEIIEGLNGDEEIITGPYALVSKTLKSGDKVKSVTEKPKKEEEK